MSWKFSVRADLLRACSFATSKDKGRYYISGIYIASTEDNKIRMVATNGNILTCACDNIVHENMQPFSKVIFTTPELLAACRNSCEMVEFTVNDARSVSWKTEPKGETKLGICSTDDGSIFPEYRRVIPSNCDTETALPYFSTAVMKALIDTANTAYGYYVPKGESDKVSYKPRSRSMKFTNSEKMATNSPCFVQYSDTQDIFSIAMPVRQDQAVALPDWFA